MSESVDYGAWAAVGLLDEYQDILSTSSSDLGRTTKVQHRIYTGDHPPVRQPVWRAPAAQRKQAQEELQRMVEKEVVPWASPLVLVKKKDGSLHFCDQMSSYNVRLYKLCHSEDPNSEA